jgi:multisubunit Na+/H+ antiporter MnhE subunit
MFDLLFGLVVGAGIGYGLRSYLSHRRHAARRRPTSLA